MPAKPSCAISLLNFAMLLAAAVIASPPCASGQTVYDLVEYVDSHVTQACGAAMIRFPETYENEFLMDAFVMGQTLEGKPEPQHLWVVATPNLNIHPGQMGITTTAYIMAPPSIPSEFLAERLYVYGVLGPFLVASADRNLRLGIQAPLNITMIVANLRHQLIAFRTSKGAHSLKGRSVEFASPALGAGIYAYQISEMKQVAQSGGRGWVGYLDLGCTNVDGVSAHVSSGSSYFDGYISFGTPKSGESGIPCVTLNAQGGDWREITYNGCVPTD